MNWKEHSIKNTPIKFGELIFWWLKIWCLLSLICSWQVTMYCWPLTCECKTIYDVELEA